MFEDEFVLIPETDCGPVRMPGEESGYEALQVAELVMATLFKRRYAHLTTEPACADARHLQETLALTLAA